MPFVNCLRDICYACSVPHIIVGDFNLPNLDWVKLVPHGNVKSSEILSWCCDLGLVQLNLEPTTNTKILDLLFTNDILIISSICSTEPFCTSDHDAIEFSAIFDCNTNK